MTTIKILCLVLVWIGSIFVGVAVTEGRVASPGLTCFLSGERESGTLKICYYDCAGSEAAITVKAYQICPLSIRR